MKFLARTNKIVARGRACWLGHWPLLSVCRHDQFDNIVEVAGFPGLAGELLEARPVNRPWRRAESRALHRRRLPPIFNRLLRSCQSQPIAHGVVRHVGEAMIDDAANLFRKAPSPFSGRSGPASQR